MSGGYKVIKEDIIESEINKKYRLVNATIQTPDGKEVVWQYIKTRPVVVVAAFDDQNRIYCIRQWRPARKDYVWELPAGGIEDKDPTDEQVMENANRELQEEIGFRAEKMEIVTRFTPTVHFVGVAYVVKATKLVENKLPNDENEEIEIKTLPFAEAEKLLIRDQIPSSATLVGVLSVKNLHWGAV